MGRGRRGGLLPVVFKGQMQRRCVRSEVEQRGRGRRGGSLPVVFKGQMQGSCVRSEVEQRVRGRRGGPLPAVSLLVRRGALSTWAREAMRDKV